MNYKRGNKTYTASCVLSPYSPESWNLALLLSRLRTTVCDLSTYCTHFDPEKEMCECREVESCKHFLLLCLLYAASRATLRSAPGPSSCLLPAQLSPRQQGHPPIPCQLGLLRLALLASSRPLRRLKLALPLQPTLSIPSALSPLCCTHTLTVPSLSSTLVYMNFL